ncbi:hypothetical protein TNCT_399321 [Trichonephila clavata]|uniref:Uncharacterized protein n=1 Tax=Trichonephila clavata TaxID=2740835 RepID=A0A8X6GSB6_TRICU|nr:hypothetical protein TNCT_399321 [Trichonephila clavata]
MVYIKKSMQTKPELGSLRLVRAEQILQKVTLPDYKTHVYPDRLQSKRWGQFPEYIPSTQNKKKPIRRGAIITITEGWQHWKSHRKHCQNSTKGNSHTHSVEGQWVLGMEYYSDKQFLVEVHNISWKTHLQDNGIYSPKLQFNLNAVKHKKLNVKQLSINMTSDNSTHEDMVNFADFPITASPCDLSADSNKDTPFALRTLFIWNFHLGVALTIEERLLQKIDCSPIY